jgi:hypothetical protein
MFSILSQLFVTERHRPRSGGVGFSLPVFGEQTVKENIEPLLVTNMRNEFVQTQKSRDGYARYGFSECPLEKEEELFLKFFEALIREGHKNGWGNVTLTLSLALERMSQNGIYPSCLVMGNNNEEVNSTAFAKERVFIADSLPKPTALLVAQAPFAGTYNRIGDHVGVLAQHADKAFVVVLPE